MKITLPALVLVATWIALQVAYSESAPSAAVPGVYAEDASGDRVDLIALRQAIVDLSERFPQSYPNGTKYLERLNQLEVQLEQDPKAIEKLRVLQHEALIANPLVSGSPILFVERPQYKSDHHNTATLFQTGEINTASFEGGSAIKTIDFAKGGKVKTLIALSKGMLRDPEIHFDAQRIIFSMRKSIDDNYHIYEMNIDGTGLQQLTNAPQVSDFDPFYLPGGDVVFSSTREPKYCMCNRHIMGNLHRMESDGANIHQIGKSTLFEGHGTLTPEGTILYYRWEYVDRNFGDAQSLWTVNPDGTNHSVYWGNNTNSPGAVIDARPIPGTQQVVCIFGSCHDRPWGAIAIIDRRLGLDGKDPVQRIWPKEAIELIGVGDFDTFKKVKIKYEDPFPLDDTYFLCSRMTGRGEQMGLYLLDTFGNEIQLYKNGPGIFDPMPIRISKRPAELPKNRDYNNDNGYFFVSDVYEGTHLKGVERGDIKALRVVESPEKRTWSKNAWNGQGQEAPAMNWHDFNNKRILGTVPVHEDGSAYFEVPSDTYVYFQLLDENGMMVQSMRSGVIVQSGETSSCVGCHDNRNSAPAFHNGGGPSLASQKKPATLTGWYGEARLFDYLSEVQPVFDKHCIQCHDYGNAQGDLNLSGDRNMTFNTSYNELWRKGLVAVTGAGPSEIQEARSWGSLVSPLISTLHTGHYNVELDAESMNRIVTWIDINAPYYPGYETNYPDNLAGRAPISETQVTRLEVLTGVPFGQLADFQKNTGPQANFDRPELSPGLQHISQAKRSEYNEALAILHTGKMALDADARETICASPADQARIEKYRLRKAIENENRTAITHGMKIYDKDHPNALIGAHDNL